MKSIKLLDCHTRRIKASGFVGWLNPEHEELMLLDLAKDIGKE